MLCEFRAAETLGKEIRELISEEIIEKAEGRRSQRCHLYHTELESGLNLKVVVMKNCVCCVRMARVLFQQREWEAFGNHVWGFRDYKTSVWPKQS